MIALLRNGRSTSLAILVYAVTAVALYACSLPLWEGWDEPFHYGYVETLAVQRQLPLLNKSTVSREIADSLMLTPLPRFLAKAVHGSISLEDWHKWTPQQRTDLRAQLQRLSPQLREQEGGNPNYEAQQTPLAYALLMPLDELVGRMQLLGRILFLRLLEAVASIIFLFLALQRLARYLALPEPYEHALLFCGLSVQVLWAAISHVGNDALAIPLTLWFLTFLMGRTKLFGAALVLAAGLLGKAYFLSFVPVFAVACVYRWRRGEANWRKIVIASVVVVAVAAPWYVRNVRLYHSFSGTQESASGIGVSKALTAVPHIHWFRSLFSFFRSSLWTGDWSFIAYSRGTLAVEQLLLVAGFVLYLSKRKRMQPAEWLVWTACGFFGLGLFYQTCVTWVHTHGEATMPEPWYWQGVAVCLFALLFAGFARMPSSGKFFAIAFSTVTAWVAFSTFWFKMLPGYGGGVGRATVGAVFSWWTAHPAADLQNATLAPPLVVFFLLACFTALLAYVASQVIGQLFASRTLTLEHEKQKQTLRAGFRQSS